MILFVLIIWGSGDSIQLRSGSLNIEHQQAQDKALSGVGVVVLRDKPSMAQLIQIRSAYRLLGVLSERAFLVDFGDGVEIRKHSLVDWQGKLPGHLKLSPTFGEHGRDSKVHVMVSPHTNLAAWFAKWPELRFRTTAMSKFFVLLELKHSELDPRLADVLLDPAVIWVEAQTPKSLMNDRSVWIGQSGLAGGQQKTVHDRGLLGANQIVAFMDTGLDADHCSFYDAVEGLPNEIANPDQRKVLAYLDLGNEGNLDSQGHGTHVGGSIAGDDVGYGTHNGFDGMAPQAKLVVQDGGYAVDPFADLPFLPADYYNDLYQPAFDLGARIHSNSWGAHEDFGVNDYTAECVMTDEFMWDNPDFLIFFAAGNAGHSGGPTISDPATAKNVIAVGATQGGTAADSMASFSSSGPVVDGRMKPDLVTPGAGINSAGNSATFNNCGQATLSGTSMACPTAAGLAALVRQYYFDGFYPSGLAQVGDAFSPSAALVKATMIASAVPLSSQTTYPNNIQGFGRVELDGALFFDGDSEQVTVIDHVGLNQGQSATYPVDINDDETLKVVLVWTDYPSTPLADVNLVNDLNLFVDGAVDDYWGNNFVDGYSATGGSSDMLNNVEMIKLPAMNAGHYDISIMAETVPQGPQPFALVIIKAPVPDTVTLLEVEPLSATTGQQLFYQVEVPQDVVSLRVITTGSNGDADLYVRYGSPPTTSISDASSTGPNSNESVVVGAPAEGTWHILVHAWSAFSGVRLEVYYEIWPSQCGVLANLWSNWPVTTNMLDLVASQNCLSAE